jgi:Ca2+-binding EF-hand superfamily protein
MDSLQSSQIDQLRTVFTVYASASTVPPYEGMLLIGHKELNGIFHALQMDQVTETEIDTIIARADTTGRGMLDFEEFVQLMTGELQDTDVDAELVEAFARCDQDKDGLLSVKDISLTLEKYPLNSSGSVRSTVASKGIIKADVPLTTTDITGLVFEISGPSSKGITVDQFLTAMKQQEP